MAGYGDILDSFISGQNQALANQMDMARLRETQNQNRLAQSNWRQQFSADERQRAITNQQNAETLKINQGNLAINQNQDSRAQTEFDDRTLMQNKSRAARDLEQLVGTQGTLESALAAGDINLDDVDLFLRNHGTTLGLFNGTDGSPRQYRGVEQIIGPDGQPVPGAFTFRLYDPRTMLDGPMTSEGGSGGQERVEIFDYAKLQPMLRQIDRTARTMRGDASRTDLTQFAESNNQLLTNQPLQSNASNAALAAPAQPAQPAQTSQPTPVETPAIPTGVAGGRGNTVEAPNARQAAYVTAQRDSALAEFDQQVAPLQRKARWEELSMRRRGFLSPEEIDELDALQQEFGGFQRPGRGGSRTGNENRDAFTAAMEGRAALAAQFQIPQVGQTAAPADPANQTAQYNPQALAAPAAPATQTSSQRVAAKTQELVNAVTPQTDSMRDAMVTQRNVGLGMIDQGINYRGRPRTADELGVAFALGRNGQQYDLYGNAQNRDADLSSTDISNYVSGDDVRGTNLEQAGRMATAGSNLTSQANTALTSMRNKDEEIRYKQAKDRADTQPSASDLRAAIDFADAKLPGSDVVEQILTRENTFEFLWIDFPSTKVFKSDLTKDKLVSAVSNTIQRTDPRVFSESPLDTKQLSDAVTRGIYEVARYNDGQAMDEQGFQAALDSLTLNVGRVFRDLGRMDIDTTRLGGDFYISMGLSGYGAQDFIEVVYEPMYNAGLTDPMDLLRASQAVKAAKAAGKTDADIRTSMTQWVRSKQAQQ